MKRKNKRMRAVNLEASALGRVQVRLIEKSETKRWNQVVKEHHYLKSKLVGPQLRYVAEVDGNWRVLISIGPAALHLEDRDNYIGWDDIQRGRRLKFIGQNNRLVIVDAPQQNPNLVSRVMKLLCRRVSDDWQQRYGNPLFGLETFVDPEYFPGTCYKASGWQALGMTKGYGRKRKDFYQAHGRPKELYFRTLWRRGMKLLARKTLPEQYQAFETDYRLCPFLGPAVRSLFDLFTGVVDPRKRRGRRYPLQTLLTVVAMGTACGMKGPRAIASFASHLTPTQRRMLRCPRDHQTGAYRSPGETCIREVLYAVDPQQVEERLAEWMYRLDPAQRPNIAIDGKTIKGTAKRDTQGQKIGQLHLVMACTHEGRMLLQERVDKKENEIVGVKRLLARMPPLRGAVITGDAINTQQELVRTIVWEKGGIISCG